MKKLILYTSVILINIFYSHSGFSYDLKVKNFNYLASNILEFDIYMKGATPQYYWTAQYAFNFNAAFANGGNLTFTRRNVVNTSTDLPNPIRPPCLGVYGNELRLTPNLPNSNYFQTPFELSTNGDGTRIIRIRVTTTACSFAGNLNLSWKNSAGGGFYTKVYDAEYEEREPGDPEMGYYFTSFTNITNSASHSIDQTITSASNVTITTTPASTTNNYLTLEQAFTAINQQSPVNYTGKNVIVSVNASTVENTAAVLNSAGQFTSCLIIPAANNLTVTATTCTNDLVVLDGAANVTIDGRVNGTGPVQLTLININPGNSNSCVRMKNGANTNLVNYVRCNGLSGATGGTTIAISQTTSTGNNYNRIENNIINRGKTGIENYGTIGANANNGNIFKSNFIRNCSTAGISLCNGSTGSNVQMNEFKNDVTTSLDANYSAIECKAEGTNDIQQNKIYDELINPGVVNYYGIKLSSGSAASIVNVSNNFLRLSQNNLKHIRGIFTTGSVSLTANINHNSIYLSGSDLTTAETFGIYADVETVAGYNQKNNICINKRTGGSLNSAINVISSAGTNLDVDYNCYWADQTTGKSGGWNSLYVSRHIPKYQCNAFPNEKNSIFKDVTFFNTASGDLHLTGTSLGDYDLIGTALPSVNTDIDAVANSRNANVPYMGADEGTAFVFDGTIKIRAYIDNYRYPQTGTFDIEVWECNAAGRTLGLLGNYPGTVFNSNGIMRIDCPAAKTIPPTNKFYIVLKHQYAIETWSKDLGETFTTVPGNYLEYNFTSGADKAFAYNMKTCCNKAYVFYGDTNEDGYIEFTYDIFDTWVASLPTPSTDPKFDMDFNLPVPTNMTDVKIVQESNTWFPVIVTDPTINGAYTNRPGEASNSYEVDYLAPDPGNTCDCNPVQN